VIDRICSARGAVVFVAPRTALRRATNRGLSLLSNIEQTAAPAEFDRLQREDTSPQPRQRLKIGKRGLQLLSWLAPVALVVTWEILAQRGWLSPQVLPAPSKVIRTAFKLVTAGSLLNDLGISLLMAENLRTGNVWKWFMANAAAPRAFALAGIQPV